MIVKAKPNRVLVAEGTYSATVKTITGKPSDDKPKRYICTFSLDGRAEVVEKDWPANIDRDSPLLKDAETLLGRELTRAEAESGFDLQELVGKPCRVVVMHKSGAGGRPVAAVSHVQAALTPVAS